MRKPKLSDDDESERYGRESAVSRRQVIQNAGVGLSITFGLAAVANPVAAEQGAIYDLFDDDSSRLGKAISALRGGLSRVFADDEKRSARESARETTDVFNQSSETLVSYVNNQVGGSRDKTNFDVIRLEFIRDVSVERWIVADVDQETNDFVSASMVDEKPSRDVDHWVELEGLAAVDAPDELERFVDEYAEEGRSIDSKLEGRIAGRYGPDVKTSLL